MKRYVKLTLPEELYQRLKKKMADIEMPMAGYCKMLVAAAVKDEEPSMYRNSREKAKKAAKTLSRSLGR